MPIQDSPWKDRAASAFWYFLLPAALAIGAVQGAAAAGLLQEAAPWEYLLAFAVLTTVIAAVRDRVRRGHGRDGVRDLSVVAADGRALEREAARLLKKARSPESVRREFDECAQALDAAIKKRDARQTAAEVRRLEGLIEKHLARVRTSSTWEYFRAIAVAVLFALALRTLVIEAFKIPSASMYPTLNVGDNIFVNRFVYGPQIPFTHSRFFAGSAPRRGEVAVFAYPVDEHVDFIKRIIGVPGDHIRVHGDGAVEVNGHAIPRCEIGPWPRDGGDGTAHEAGEALPRAFLEWHGGYHYIVLQSATPVTHPECTTAVREEYVVPAGHVFAMGDNRDFSLDSRCWGPVPARNIKGRALWIWWSNVPGAGCGMRWSRFGNAILGEPHIPASLQAGYDACVRRGPPR